MMDKDNVKSKLASLAENILSKIQDANCDTMELLSQTKESVDEMISCGIKPEISQINSVISESYDELLKVAARTDGIRGLASAFHSLDKLTSGWQNGELITIAARPGMGKTAFILSMLKNITVNDKQPVALFSLEMSRVQVGNRLIMNISELSGEKIKSGQLAPYEWGQLDYKIKELKDAPLYIDDNPVNTIENICRISHSLVHEKGIRLIVIDYIQLLYNKIKYTDTRYLDLNYFTRRLKSLARELNIPIIITSQLNRGVESREGIEGKVPQLYDLRDSGTICDDSDMVLFIHRPEYYKIFQDDKGNDLRGMAQIIIAKHRNGSVGEVLLRFRDEYSRFQNPDDDLINLILGEGRLRSNMNGNELYDGPAPF